MNEYYLSEQKEHALVKIVCRTTKKWIIGNIVAVVFGVIGAVLVILILTTGGVSAESLALSLAALLIPVIGVLISLAIARTGGRDILFARLGEKACLTDTELVESYTPRFKTIDTATLVENHITYSSITGVIHEKSCRYVIYGDVKTVRYGASAETVVTQNDKIVLYDYFEDMPELLANLMKKCNVQIKEES